MRTDSRMICDVCGCETGHLTLAKPEAGRPHDECQPCRWTRKLGVDELRRQRDDATLAIQMIADIVDGKEGAMERARRSIEHIRAAEEEES